jgi:hypothetical protein
LLRFTSSRHSVLGDPNFGRRLRRDQETITLLAQRRAASRSSFDDVAYDLSPKRR